MRSRSKAAAAPAKGTWEHHKIKLKEKFPLLSDEDFHYEPGKSHEMFERIQTKTGKNKHQMAEIIATIIQGKAE